MEPLPLSDRPRPVFGITSIVCAALTFLLPIGLVWLMAATWEERPDDQNKGWGWLIELVLALVVAVIAAAVPALIGTIIGIISLARQERLKGLAIAGLVICGGLLALLAVVILSSQAR